MSLTPTKPRLDLIMYKTEAKFPINSSKLHVLLIIFSLTSLNFYCCFTTTSHSGPHKNCQ